MRAAVTLDLNECEIGRLIWINPVTQLFVLQALTETKAMGDKLQRPEFQAVTMDS